MDYRAFYRGVVAAAALALTGCPTTPQNPQDAYKQEQRDRQRLDELQREIEREQEMRKLRRP